MLRLFKITFVKNFQPVHLVTAQKSKKVLKGQNSSAQRKTLGKALPQHPALKERLSIFDFAGIGKKT